MRFIVGIIVVLITAVALYANDSPATRPLDDLGNNTLVQKALTEKDKVIADADADYAKKLEVLKTERQRKVDAANSACINVLRRAETVANTLNHKDEAATIKALADRIQNDIAHPAPEPSKKTVVKIDAKNAQWTPAAKVHKGQTIVITAAGICLIGRNRHPFDADGKKGDHTGTLMGRIGDSSEFVVGKSFSQTADEDGVLQLRLNDKIYEDNTGELTVTIEVK